jgi:3D (Asp-Asp-Asp) domain-containing protein/peptidoglycan hydrolase CwlO-like protein
LPFLPVGDGAVWYRRAAVRGRHFHLARGVLVVLSGLLLFGGIPATGPAQGPGVTSLRQKGAELERRSRAAVLDLYALGSRLEQTRAELARLDARLAGLRHEQATARQQYRAALVTQSRAQQQLGAQLRLLYEQDEPDPIAVILGAASLEEAVEGLDNIKRFARATENVLDQASQARTEVTRERQELAAKVARTGAARARAAAGADELLRAQAEREAYIAQLRTEQQLNAQQIAAVERRAAEAQQRAQLVTQQAREHAAPPSANASAPSASTSTDASSSANETTTFETPSTAAPGEPPPAPVEGVSQSSSGATASAPGPPKPGGTLNVYATGYCLTGTTATGLPVGPGIVAVDPTVIPLGTRMSIPGYGDGVAADTGGAIKGNRIDVWFASCKEAGAFSRNVTITFL